MTLASTTFQRALFIRFGGIGDILMATPSVRALAAKFPGIAIDFVVGGGMTDALSGHPNIRQIWTFDKRGLDSRFDHFVPFLSRLRRQNYDLVVDLHPHIKSFLMASASFPCRRLTFGKRMNVLPETGRVSHAIDDFLKELAPLGIENVTDKRLNFFVPDAARRSVAELLRVENIVESDSVLVINPAASRPLNRWPRERFGEVAAHFAKKNDGEKNSVKVIVTGAPSSFKTVMDGTDEVSQAREVANFDKRIINLAGKLTMKEFGALLERADTLLTCDTGPMHIGAALETPLVVLSGAADPNRTGPLTNNSTILIDKTLPCVPCRDRICRRGDVKCMDLLSVENVIDAVTMRLRSRHGIALPVRF